MRLDPRTAGLLAALTLTATASACAILLPEDPQVENENLNRPDAGNPVEPPDSCATLVWDAPTLPEATVGIPWSFTLHATGGQGPLTYLVEPIGGDLPAGFVVDAATGVLSLTPSAAGEYRLRVTVSDACAATPQAVTHEPLLRIYARATDYNPRFPRLGMFQWGGGPPEIYARYDLLDFTLGHARSSLPASIKTLNPRVIVLATKEWRICESACPEPWQIKTSTGVPILLMSSPYADPTDFCGEVDGQRYNQALAQSYMDSLDFAVVDGVATDGLHRYALDLVNLSREQTGVEDVDLDRNGQNDLTEPSKGRDWLESTFIAGCDQLIANVRGALAGQGLDQRPILINTGAMQTEWGAGVVNGWIDEYAATSRYWGEGFIARYTQVVAQARQPAVVLINGLVDDKADFADMRFLLTETLMGDGYFDCEEMGSTEHYYKEWYDELELDLGYPTGGPQRLDNGAYARFFDSGVAVTNPQGRPLEVTDDMLQALSGYDGPYHRFRGGQAPDVNNGLPFDAVQLGGELRDTRTYGDGIILVHGVDQVVVADIVVDNVRQATLAGTEPAHLVGDWTQACCKNENSCSGAWTWGCRYSYVTDAWDIATTTSSAAQAEYRPTIGLAGNYEVYEWHPAIAGAATIQYEIVHADGTATGTIDQAQQTNRWISLGTYRFTAGTAGHVVLSGGGSLLVADAMKFVKR